MWFDVPWPDEAIWDHPGTTGIQQWRGFDCFGYVNLNKLLVVEDAFENKFNPKKLIAFASCTLYAPIACDCRLSIEGEDWFDISIGGVVIDSCRKCSVHPKLIPFHLEQGFTRVVVKCGQNATREWNDRAWGFFARLLDTSGEPLHGVLVEIGEGVADDAFRLRH
jgi:hypothetical protein